MGSWVQSGRLRDEPACGHGIQPGYTLWTTLDYEWLKTGEFPKPAWIEGVNEPPLKQYGQMYTSAANPLLTWSLPGGGSMPNAAGYNVGDIVNPNGDWSYICIKQHTPSAANKPPKAGDTSLSLLNFNNGYWQSLRRAVRTVNAVGDRPRLFDSGLVHRC